ncbi:alpha/beta fold hydrolase [Luteococcus sp. Sow4_B9]|uniref:alpha/beta fold hydrolase n=1 Tax=Luteococcus sp. Sow4_B9 TaxID=3438792 RepID=UPI003F9519A7
MDITYDSTSKMVKTRRWNIHINEAGSGDQVIFMLHGSGPGATGWSNFSKNIPVLAEQYRVIAVDMPGWGESDPVTYQERDHSTALADLMDELGVDKAAAVIGNSMGGGTTVRFGYEHPERVEKLITMGSSSGSSSLFGAAGFTEGLKILQKGYREPSFETMRELVDIMTFDSSFATDELIQGRADMVKAHPEHNQNFIDGTGKRAVVELDFAKVRTIKAPALLFHGRDDRVVPFEHSLRLTSLIPDSRLILINRCGHWLQIEHTEEFNRQVLSFLAN